MLILWFVGKEVMGCKRKDDPAPLKEYKAEVGGHVCLEAGKASLERSFRLYDRTN